MITAESWCRIVGPELCAVTTPSVITPDGTLVVLVATEEDWRRLSTGDYAPFLPPEIDGILVRSVEYRWPGDVSSWPSTDDA